MDGVGRLEAFARGGRIAVREADDRADGELAVHILRRLLDVGRRDADRRGMILHAVVADRANFLPRRRLRQQRMVYLTQNLVQFHGAVPPFYVLECNLDSIYDTWRYSCRCRRGRPGCPR